MLTVKEYATAKKLPADWLRNTFFLEDGLVIPYFDQERNLVSVRYRFELDGPNRFKWRKGDKPILYGLDRFFRDQVVFLVEGESDAQTLAFHDRNVLGIPGASTFKKEWSRYFSIAPPWVVKEADSGGAVFIKRLLEFFPAVWVVDMGLTPYKDISDMHQGLIRQRFDEQFRILCQEADYIKALPKKSKPPKSIVPDDLDMFQVASQYTELKKGRADDWWGLCPLHPETRPSFHITVSKNVWHCFGCCKGGTPRDLLREMKAR
uniref:Putative primase n=1 Tax=viral metagenome TaxID=1070528 RepID=A0A6H1ZF89_9ZZZZ